MCECVCVWTPPEDREHLDYDGQQHPSGHGETQVTAFPFFTVHTHPYLQGYDPPLLLTLLKTPDSAPRWGSWIPQEGCGSPYRGLMGAPPYNLSVSPVFPRGDLQAGLAIHHIFTTFLVFSLQNFFS